MARPLPRLALALAMVFGGAFLASFVQTAGGTVRIEDVRFSGANGILQHARLYIPETATAESPAPGVLAIHGYINSNETQSSFAIELSRRGYVVLAADQTGHGYSDPPSGANGFGGPAALAFLRSLDIVDPANVGLEGHSMGGSAVQAAARSDPDGYQAMVLEGASMRAGQGGAAGPRNVAVVFSKYDEFSRSMWGVPIADDLEGSERLMAVFGTEEPVEEGRLYGSIAEGTARILHQPPVTHPGDHHSRRAVGQAVAWFQTTMTGGSDLPPERQVWYWKELGTLISLFGMVLLFFPVATILLGLPLFAELSESPAPSAASTGPGWWGAAAVFVALPALTLFPFKDLPRQLGISASALLPQGITTQVLAWAMGVGVISAVLFLVWHLAAKRRGGEFPNHHGLSWSGRMPIRVVGKSLVLAFLVVSAGYASLLATDFLFQTDFRFWVFAVKPMSRLHGRIFLSYVLPFTAFFVVLSTVLHAQLRRDHLSPRGELIQNVLLLTLGFVGLLLVQYVPLFAGGTMTFASESLWSIIAFQFLPIMTIVALLSTWFFRRTGHVWVGAFASGILVTWIVVASQATHHPF